MEQDYTSAALWYERSAQLGSSAGMNNFAELLAKGRGVPKDLGKAMEWYRKAAELGNVYAVYNMGWYLEKAGNLDKARACYAQAKEQNMDSAYWSLGRMYEEGLGVEQDLKQAYTLYRQGAKQGNVNCICRLVRCLAQGVGTRQDLSRAQKLGSELLAEELSPQVLDNYGCREELVMLLDIMNEIKE